MTNKPDCRFGTVSFSAAFLYNNKEKTGKKNRKHTQE
jgi:hypothetical protein